MLICGLYNGGITAKEPVLLPEFTCMTIKPPPDISETYALQDLPVHVYQTSGMEERSGQKNPCDGQADAYSVLQVAKGLEAAAMDDLMDRLHAETEFSDTASTGVIVSLSEARESSAAQRIFDVTHGHRGDSHFSIVFVDKELNVRVQNILESLPDEGYSVTEFGMLGNAGENNVHGRQIMLQEGEQAYLLVATDGYTDAYLRNPAQQAEDIKDWIKRNPAGGDLAACLTARSMLLGAADNTTVIAAHITYDTALKGAAAVVSVFDGLGHSDDRVSSHLARLMPAEVPHAVEPLPLRHERPDHLATRPDDLQKLSHAQPSVFGIQRPAATPKAAM